MNKKQILRALHRYEYELCLERPIVRNKLHIKMEAEDRLVSRILKEPEKD